MKVVPISLSTAEFIAKALPLLNNYYDQVVYLNPNQYPDYPNKPFRHLLAFGAVSAMYVFNDTRVFDSWKHIRNAHSTDWLFIYIAYDAKNSVEKLSNSQEPGIDFNAASFFIPEHVWEITSEGIILHKGNASVLISEIETNHKTEEVEHSPITLHALTSKETYLESVVFIQSQLEKGNAYEINYCIPFKGSGVIDPVKTYLKLNKLSPMPFSAYFKYSDQHIICASPERFIKKENNKLFSQPIKGTSKRGENAEDDFELLNQLRHSEKEKSENNMIVDLVRNDLSRTAADGSVKVSELRGIYTFPNVHQMISTITSELHSDYDIIDAIKYAFPMGSMTGAPKINAMELIDGLEPVSRGPFSGSIGYMDPDNNVDFNVLIRSIFFNSSTQTILMEAGSAITCYADPKEEYEECMLKIAPLKKIIEGN